MRKLLEFRRSPNCIKARIGLRLKELDFETEEMESHDRQPMIAASNWPLVPVLLDDDVHVRDSEAILHYLDSNYRDTHPLSPTDVDELRDAHRLKTEVVAGLSAVFVEAFTWMQAPEEEREEAAIAGLAGRANALLEPLERRLQETPYLFGPTPSLYDIVLACSIMGMRPPRQFVQESELWRAADGLVPLAEDLERVRAWYDGLIALDGLEA